MAKYQRHNSHGGDQTGEQEQGPRGEKSLIRILAPASDASLSSTSVSKKILPSGVKKEYQAANTPT